MKTREIINCILNYYNINPNQFAKNIGAKPTQIYDLMSGKTKKISDKMSEKIVNNYNNINKCFLLTGEGEMLKGAELNNSNNNIVQSGIVHGDNNQGNNNTQLSQQTIDKFLELLAAKDMALAKCQEQIDRLLSLLEKK